MIKKIRVEINQYIQENPLLIIYSFLGTFIVTALIHKMFVLNNETWESLCYGFILGLSLCLGGDYLFDEHPKLKKKLLLMVFFLFGIGYLLAHFLGYIPLFQNHILFATYLLFLLAPTSVRRDERVGFHWLVYVFYAVGLSYTISVVLLGLLIFLVWVIHQLFALKLPEILQHMGLATFIVFMPVNLFALFKPRPQEVSSLRYKISNLHEKTIRILFIPVMLIYIAVLLLYSLKILVQFRLPDGMVSVPISIAYVIFFLINSYLESQGKIDVGIWKYNKWIQLSFVPLFVVMAVGIGKRISDYGFTADRFYLLAAFIFMVATLVARWRYRALELRRLIFLGAVILFATSFGPLSPVRISTQSQISRLLSIFLKYGSAYSKLENFKLSEWKISDIQSAHSAFTVIERYRSMDELKKQGLQRNVFATTDENSNLEFKLEELRERVAALDKPHFLYGVREKEEDKDERVCQAFSVPYSKRFEIANIKGYNWYFNINSVGSSKDAIQILPDTKDKIEVDLVRGLILLSRGETSEVVMDFANPVRKLVPTTAAGSVKEPLELIGEVKGYRIKMLIDDVALDCPSPSIHAKFLVQIL